MSANKMSTGYDTSNHGTESNNMFWDIWLQRKNSVLSPQLKYVELPISYLKETGQQGYITSVIEKKHKETSYHTKQPVTDKRSNYYRYEMNYFYFLTRTQGHFHTKAIWSDLNRIECVSLVGLLVLGRCESSSEWTKQTNLAILENMHLGLPADPDAVHLQWEKQMDCAVNQREEESFDIERLSAVDFG